MPNLKLITTRSTGFEHIDKDSAKTKNIIICNVPYYGENTVAEHTFALILTLSRKIYSSYQRILSNNYSTHGLQGFDLKGKTIGVIGSGRIGMHVIRMANGFGMKAQAYDVKRNTLLSEILNFEYVSLDTLLKSSDIISLHAPYNNNTHHIINQANISIIKKGALLINTSRGALVETDALISALDLGILSGAGLDVLEGEEYLMEEDIACKEDQCVEAFKLIKQQYSLVHRENVVVTPHNAFNSQESVERIIDTTIENITMFLSENPINTIQ
jgi:D-lactate dehydrogenase